MDTQVAVKALIMNANGQFLIVREEDRWQAVGGRLDSGEKLAEGLAREAKEETGITDMAIGEVVHVDEWFAKPEGTLKHIVAIYFICNVSSGVSVILSSEHQEFAWVKAEELEAYGDSLQSDLTRAITAAERYTKSRHK